MTTSVDVPCMTNAASPERSPTRVLTGDRPTGRLHLVGSLRKCVGLQSQYDTILLIADLPAATARPDCATLTS